MQSLAEIPIRLSSVRAPELKGEITAETFKAWYESIHRVIKSNPRTIFTPKDNQVTAYADYRSQNMRLIAGGYTEDVQRSYLVAHRATWEYITSSLDSAVATRMDNKIKQIVKDSGTDPEGRFGFINNPDPTFYEDVSLFLKTMHTIYYKNQGMRLLDIETTRHNLKYTMGHNMENFITSLEALHEAALAVEPTYQMPGDRQRVMEVLHKLPHALDNIKQRFLNDDPSSTYEKLLAALRNWYSSYMGDTNRPHTRTSGYPHKGMVSEVKEDEGEHGYMAQDHSRSSRPSSRGGRGGRGFSNRRNNNNREYTMAEVIEAKRSGFRDYVKSSGRIYPPNGIFKHLTQEEKQAIIDYNRSIRGNQTGNVGEVTNEIAAFTICAEDSIPYDQMIQTINIANSGTRNPSHFQYLLDSAATSHVVCDKSQYEEDTATRVHPVTVNTLGGRVVSDTVGDVRVKNNLLLLNARHIGGANPYNLISVSQLVAAGNQVLFAPDRAVIYKGEPIDINTPRLLKYEVLQARRMGGLFAYEKSHLVASEYPSGVSFTPSRNVFPSTIDHSIPLPSASERLNNTEVRQSGNILEKIKENQRLLKQGSTVDIYGDPVYREDIPTREQYEEQQRQQEIQRLAAGKKKAQEQKIGVPSLSPSSLPPTSQMRIPKKGELQPPSGSNPFPPSSSLL